MSDTILNDKQTQENLMKLIFRLIDEHKALPWYIKYLAWPISVIMGFVITVAFIVDEKKAGNVLGDCLTLLKKFGKNLAADGRKVGSTVSNSAADLQDWATDMELRIIDHLKETFPPSRIQKWRRNLIAICVVALVFVIVGFLISDLANVVGRIMASMGGIVIIFLVFTLGMLIFSIPSFKKGSTGKMFYGTGLSILNLAGISALTLALFLLNGRSSSFWIFFAGPWGMIFLLSPLTKKFKFFKRPLKIISGVYGLAILFTLVSYHHQTAIYMDSLDCRITSYISKLAAVINRDSLLDDLLTEQEQKFGMFKLTEDAYLYEADLTTVKRKLPAGQELRGIITHPDTNFTPKYNFAGELYICVRLKVDPPIYGFVDGMFLTKLSEETQFTNNRLAPSLQSSHQIAKLRVYDYTFADNWTQMRGPDSAFVNEDGKPGVHNLDGEIHVWCQGNGTIGFDFNLDRSTTDLNPTDTFRISFVASTQVWQHIQNRRNIDDDDYGRVVVDFNDGQYTHEVILAPDFNHGRLEIFDFPVRALKYGQNKIMFKVSDGKGITLYANQHIIIDRIENSYI